MIGLVLVIVVGPKDMPKVLRAVAKYVGKARNMASDFQSSMMEVANQDEFNDVKKACRMLNPAILTKSLNNLVMLKTLSKMLLLMRG